MSRCFAFGILVALELFTSPVAGWLLRVDLSGRLQGIEAASLDLSCQSVGRPGHTPCRPSAFRPPSGWYQMAHRLYGTRAVR